MKNLINKGLLYKDWFYGRWLMLVTLVEYLFTYFYGFNNFIKFFFDYIPVGIPPIKLKITDIFSGIAGSYLIPFISTIIFTGIIIGIDGVQSSSSLNVMPIKKSTIISTKLSMCILITAIPSIICSIIMSIDYIIKSNFSSANEVFRVIIIWLFLNILVNAFVDTLTILAIYICKNIILGVCFSGILMFLPTIVYSLFYGGISYYLKFQSKTDAKFGAIGEYLCPALYNSTEVNVSFRARFFILILCILIIYYLTINVFCNNRFESLQRKKHKIPVKAINLTIAIFIGFFTSVLIFSETDTSSGILTILPFIFCGIIIVTIYIMLDRFIET